MSDVCISLFDPVKFKTSAPTRHNLDKLQNMQTGAKYYRSVKIHKNTWVRSATAVESTL